MTVPLIMKNMPSAQSGQENRTIRRSYEAGNELDLDGLEPISLAQLNEAASLLTRVDRKYLVPSHVAQELLHVMAPSARALEIDAVRSFAYSSTYFDTPGLDSYFQSARKRRRRFKVRSRSYLDSGLSFLEVKTRGMRGATVKERISAEPDIARSLNQPGRTFIRACLTQAGVACPDDAARIAARLQPVMSTRYHRSTVLIPDADARLTLDTNLVWNLLSYEANREGETVRRKYARGWVIVETKNPSTPSAADRWLWRSGYRPSKVSKYATGMAVLHPELPANKWHRVINRELAGV